jgi:hypothetical protein
MACLFLYVLFGLGFLCLCLVLEVHLLRGCDSLTFSGKKVHCRVFTAHSHTIYKHCIVVVHSGDSG